MIPAEWVAYGLLAISGFLVIVGISDPHRGERALMTGMLALIAASIVTTVAVWT